MSGHNGFASFQAEAIRLHNKREEHAAIMQVVNQHADCLEHLMQGLEKMFYELQKRDFQIEALLTGNAHLTQVAEGLHARVTALEEKVAQHG